MNKDVSLLNENNMITSIDLVSARQGKSAYRITTGNLTLPDDRIHIVNISPSRIELKFEKAPPQRSQTNQARKRRRPRSPFNRFFSSRGLLSPYSTVGLLIMG